MHAKMVDDVYALSTEFMPNYQDMMSSSLSAGKSSFGNFSEVNSMLKGFIDLQKEQLEVERAKAETEKAKLELVNDTIQIFDQFNKIL